MTLVAQMSGLGGSDEGWGLESLTFCCGSCVTSRLAKSDSANPLIGTFLLDAFLLCGGSLMQTQVPFSDLPRKLAPHMTKCGEEFVVHAIRST
jgi:hypothetical protein